MRDITVDIVDHFRSDETPDVPGVAAQFRCVNNSIELTVGVMFTPVLHEEHASVILGVVPGTVHVRVLNELLGQDAPTGTVDIEELFTEALPAIAASSVRRRCDVLTYRINLFGQAAMNSSAPVKFASIWRSGVSDAEEELQALRTVLVGQQELVMGTAA